MLERLDVSIAPVAPRSVAGIGAFRDRDRDRLLAALGAEFGMQLPEIPRSVEVPPVRLSCLAPTRFLASGPREADLPRRLASQLAGIAAITDQSDLWHLVLVAGPRIREVLARVVPVDLAPEKFAVGDLALTRAGHLDVRVWRVAGDGYEVAVARSYAADLDHALQAASGYA